ncbi:MAG: hypothetical protein AVDCRST_MAG01-01-2438, partial [uncultured Rubrobacteraceae bacterium]
GSGEKVQRGVRAVPGLRRGARGEAGRKAAPGRHRHRPSGDRRPGVPALRGEVLPRRDGQALREDPRQAFARGDRRSHPGRQLLRSAGRL